jgi:hypothetical protein
VHALTTNYRATDVIAYKRAGLTSNRIWIEETQYADEVRPLAMRGFASGFTSYADLRSHLQGVLR